MDVSLSYSVAFEMFILMLCSMESKSNPLQVKEAPYPSASGNEVVIQNKAVSVNPVDWKIQDSGYFVENVSESDGIHYA